MAGVLTNVSYGLSYVENSLGILANFAVSNVWHIKLDDRGKQGLLSWAALVESKLISSFKLCLNQTKAQHVHVLVKCDNN